ncbi:MAG TPA: hypothetical protein VGO22_22935 [Pseudorhizobium sp.]|jgi:hypothetical protein|nr:hypothetical protein [Pseudorhizobium sp.]
MTQETTYKPVDLPALAVDWEFYAQFLEETDATDEEKRELIITIWSVAVSFVELGFGVHGVQQVGEYKQDSNLTLSVDLINTLTSKEENNRKIVGGRDVSSDRK